MEFYGSSTTTIIPVSSWTYFKWAIYVVNSHPLFQLTVREVAAVQVHKVFQYLPIGQSGKGAQYSRWNVKWLTLYLCCLWTEMAEILFPGTFCENVLT